MNEPDAINQLVDLVDQMVRESGNPEGFDARAWVLEWLQEPCRALGGRRPSEYLGTDEGRATLAGMLWAMQAGSYL